MYQISTGKFFDEDMKVIHKGQFVFYTNISIFRPFVNSSPDFTIESLELGDVSCYLVSYVLITEDHPVVARAGDTDYVDQFLRIWAMYFNCIAKRYREEVVRLCKEKRVSSFDDNNAFEYSPETVRLAKNITPVELSGFADFSRALVGSSRESYKSAIAAMRAIDDSKQIVASNFDLAYSMIVYALESLSQRHDGYVPVWGDFDGDMKSKIDKQLSLMPIDISDAVRNILIDGKQFKLRKRFEAFIENNLGFEFYRKNLGGSNRTLRRIHLKRCLKNLYELRSGYVHELRPLDVMLSSPGQASSDYLIRFGEPYLTYTGLLRLAREVLLNFVDEPEAEIEKINWSTEISGSLLVEIGGREWISDPDRFDQKIAKHWLSAALDLIANKTLPHQHAVCERIMREFDSYKDENRGPAINYLWLYNAVLKEKMAGWSEFIEPRVQFVESGIYPYFVISHLCGRFDVEKNTDGERQEIDLNDFLKDYQAYDAQRFHKNGFSASAISESLLLCAAVNCAVTYEDGERYQLLRDMLADNLEGRQDALDLVDFGDSLKEIEFTKLWDVLLNER